VTPPRTLLRLRHTGGEERAVTVEDATLDGSLHVRWPNLGGVYVIKVFGVKEFGEGRLFTTKGARIPLLWTAVDVEEAKAIWRRMTGRTDPLRWKQEYKNGRRVWVPK